MLHLIFQSPIEHAVLDRIDTGDVLVFLQDAAFLALKGGVMADDLASLVLTNPMYTLADDLLVRGIKEEQLLAGIGVLDYAGLVDLTTKHAQIQSWVQ